MKDLLLYTPLDDFAMGQYEFVPLGLLQLSSYIDQKGIQVDVLHGRTADIKPGYKFYGISATTSQYGMARSALNRIREIEPDAKVILGGAHMNAPSCVEECAKHGWDFLVIGDGEEALYKILNNEVFDQIIVGTPIRDLDSLPLPAYDKLDMSKYNYPLRKGMKCINVMTSRGCPFKCAFCSGSRTKLRQRSVDNVLSEIDLLVNKYKFDSFTFVDDTMSLNFGRYYAILSGLESFNIQWKAYARTNVSPDECLERMKRAGCIECSPGIESGNQSILDAVEKGTNVEDNIAWCKRCESIGIVCNPFIIIGLPGESLDTIRDTQTFMERAKPSAFAYNILMPFPDSPLVRNPDRFKDSLTIHPYTWDDCVTKSKKITQCFVSTPYLTREQILNEYYRNFELFVQITGFDPRERGDRGKHHEA